MLRDLIVKTRSCRRFDESHPVSRQTLEELVDLARLSASGGNQQPLKFILSCEPDRNDIVFPLITLARTPSRGERPTAYIIILGDRRISVHFGCDHGIAAQSIMLGATEKGLGGCMVGLVQRHRLAEALQIPERYEILLVLALGKPAEEPVMVPVPPDGNMRGWWDENDVRHVPKRTLDELIIG